MLHWCARRCAREHPVPTQNHAPRANKAKKNPSTSLQLAEGALGTRRIVRAVLFQLSYPPVSRIVGGDPDTVNRRARLQGRRPYVLYSSATRSACAVAAARSAS